MSLSRLLKTKAGEDPGFEIIKEVPGNSGGMPRMMGGLMGGLMAPNNMQGMFKDAGLGGMMGGMLGGQGLGALGNPNMMKSLENGGNPFKMLGGMGSNMTQQLAGLMGMQGMGMPSMVSSSYILFFLKLVFFREGWVVGCQ